MSGFCSFSYLPVDHSQIFMLWKVFCATSQSDLRIFVKMSRDCHLDFRQGARKGFLIN